MFKCACEVRQRKQIFQKNLACLHRQHSELPRILKDSSSQNLLQHHQTLHTSAAFGPLLDTEGSDSIHTVDNARKSSAYSLLQPQQSRHLARKHRILHNTNASGQYSHARIFHPYATVASALQTTVSKHIVGEIEYDPENIIGQSGTTLVYKGVWKESIRGQKVGRREVAVKKIICRGKEDCNKQLQEIEILMKCYDHQNVVKYFKTETDEFNNLYIAMELCLGTLQDWMENKIEEIERGDKNAIRILQQTAEAVEYLHAKGIIHRDIKPENILLKVVNEKVCVKLADFGLSRILPNERTSITNSTFSGTKGWKSPEALNAQSKTPVGFKMSRATDIFSLGLVFFYVLNGGNHPFDLPENPNPVHRDSNILLNKYYKYENNFSPRNRGYMALFEKMIHNVPTERPTAAEILSHPIFWNSKKELDFLFRVSNAIQKKPKTIFVQMCISRINEQHSSFINKDEFYKNDGKVVTDWQTRTCEAMRKYFLLNKFRSYDGSSACDLIRAIRNLYSHYNDLPDFVKESLGPPSDKFMLYWDNRFPFLVPVVWNVCKEFYTHAGFESIKEFYES